MASRARELFDEIMAAEPSPADSINKMIADNRQETEYLEFKGATQPDSRGGRQEIPPKTVKKYWSQALSGFGNTEGGVLVWGVDARPTPSPDDPTVMVDMACGADHVPKPTAFAEMLTAVLRDAVLDPIPGVEVLPIEPGFVVCYVPEGKHKPYRAALDESKNYFQRANTSFVILSHSLLRSLFYPRIGPSFQMMVSIREFIQDYQERRGLILATVDLWNTGNGTAKKVNCHVVANRGWKILNGTDAQTDSGWGVSNTGLLRCGLDIHPQQRANVCRIQWEDRPDHIFGLSLVLRASVYCEDHAPDSFAVEYTQENLEDQVPAELIPIEEDS